MLPQDLYIIIPTGGEGKRLKPYTENRSKPLVPVINNFPILELILYALTHGAKLRKFIFGVKGANHYINLQNYFQGGSGWSGKLGITPQAHFEYQNPNYSDTGNADSARYNIQEFSIDQPVIICQSDNLFWGEDIKNFSEVALKSSYDFVVALTHVQDGSQLGVAEYNPMSHQITNFLEKPGDAYKNGALVNTGIYFIKPSVFNFLHADFGKHVIPQLTAKGLVGGYIFDHPWYDFGNPQEHLASVLSLLRSPTPCMENFLARVCTQYRNENCKVWVRGRSSFALKQALQTIDKIRDGKIKVEGSVFIGKDSVVEDGVYLRNCSIGDLSFVGGGTEVVESNILDAWQIGKNCKIIGSFLGRGGTVADGSLVERQFLGDNSTIGH